MIGRSIYFSEEFDLEDEIDISKDFDILFTSIHFPQSQEVFEKFKKLYQKARENKVRLCVDLNKDVLDKYQDLLDMDMIIRLDYGFNEKMIADLSQKSKISINASTVSYDFLKNIAKHNPNPSNIIAIHNFYPLVYSGLADEFFKKQNDLIRSFGFKLGAFLAGDEKLRGPIFEGLPTIEKYRKENPFIGYLRFKNIDKLDLIILSEGTSKKVRDNIINYERDRKINLDVNLIDQYKDLEGFRQRMDVSDFILRNEREKKVIEDKGNFFIKRGDILILNENSGRYSGEIEIAKKDLGNDPNRNIIGKVISEYHECLDFVKGGDQIVFNRR